MLAIMQHQDTKVFTVHRACVLCCPKTHLSTNMPLHVFLPVFSALLAFLFSAGNFSGKMHYRNYVVRIRVKLVFLVCVGGCFR